MAQTIEYNVKVNPGNSIKTLGQLESELEQINEELKDVAVGSDRFKELSKSAQDANKSIAEINSEIEGITGEDKIRGLDGAVKVLGGSVSGLVGGLGLLGVESETFGKFEEAAASAIAFGIGIKDVSEGIGQLGPLFKKSGIAAKVFGMTTKQALIATGIGAFAVALGSIIAYWDDIVKGIEKFGQKVPFVGKAIQALKDGFQSVVEFFRPVLEFLGIMPTEAEKANQAVIASNEELIKSGERELALLQARGASAEEIFKQREKMLKAELDNLKRNEAEKEEIYEKETELLALQAAEEKRIQDERDAARQERLAKEKEEKQKADEEEKARQQKLADERKAREDNAKQLAEEERLNAELIGLTEFEKEMELLDREYEEKLSKLEEFNISKEDLDANYAERKQQILDAEVEAEQAASDEKKRIAAEEQAVKDQIVNETIDNFQGALSALFGESKAVASANVLVDAGQAAVGIIKTSQQGGIFASIPYQISQFALLAATTISSLRQINSAEPKRGGGGAPQLPRGGGGFAMAPTTPTAQTPTEQQLGIAEATNRRQEPIQAYVLSGNVTSAQEADNKIRQRRTVGTN